MNTNPLGYWCAPNGATPDYVAYDSLYKVLAFILMEHTGPGWAEAIRKHPNFEEFVKELQCNTVIIFENLLDGFAALEDQHDLDGAYNYGPDDFGCMDYTTSHLMTEDEEEKNPARQVEYGQHFRLAYNEEEDVWEVCFEYGVAQEDSRAVWWKIDQTENGWLERYEQQIINAKKTLADAWGSNFRSDWKKLEVVENG